MTILSFVQIEDDYRDFACANRDFMAPDEFPTEQWLWSDPKNEVGLNHLSLFALVPRNIHPDHNAASMFLSSLPSRHQLWRSRLAAFLSALMPVFTYWTTL